MKNLKKIALFMAGAVFSAAPVFSQVFPHFQDARFIPFSYHSVWTKFSPDNRNILVFVSDQVFVPLATIADAASSDADDPLLQSIRNNHYYTESLRLTQLAHEAYDIGDYDQSTEYAEKALEYARLSDEYVAKQLKIRAADDAIAEAQAKIEWADTVNAPKRYPEEYAEAQECLLMATQERSAENWDSATDLAHQTVALLSALGEQRELPGQYTVRTWQNTKDCLWNIAAMPWAYNDPFKWKIIYEANKSIMPQSNEPDLIEPGMVLTIPSLKGELRKGMWKEGVVYPRFK